MAFNARLFNSTVLTGLSALFVSGWYGNADANPADGVVVGGDANIINSAQRVDIHQQSQRAIIDWRSFDIALDETTEFHQPNSSAIALNRIKDTKVSRIDGSLKANGNVVLWNPNGLIIGSTATIDVGGLVATTSDADDSEFMNGNKIRFNKPSSVANAKIFNQGKITAKEAGLVGLVAPQVENYGVIEAKLGQVHLASGDTFTLDFAGDGITDVAVNGALQNQLVSNAGMISANGGTIKLTAAAARDAIDSLVINTGVIEAKSVGQKEGKIILYAAGANAVKDNVTADKGVKTGNSIAINTGILDASGRNAGERGGSILVLADTIGILNGSLMDVSGHTGLSNTTDSLSISAHRDGAAGGSIMIGGDYLGQGLIPTAKNLFVDAQTLFYADSLDSGDAGRAIFWSDDTTEFGGNVYARGGKNGGNGGFVETSGHEQLNVSGFVDLTAPVGSRGTYFMDPTNISVYGNVTPTFQSTDGTINWAGSLKLWLDASDLSKITLTYIPFGGGVTATGTSGTNTVSTSFNLTSWLSVGQRVRLNGAGATTTADTMGADTYTVASVTSNSVTFVENLTTNYTGVSIMAGVVSSVLDKSGNANDATQSSDNLKPALINTNGVYSLQFTQQQGTPYLNVGNGNIMSGATAGTSFATAQQYADPPTAGLGPIFGSWGTSGSSDHVPYSDGIIYDGWGSSSRYTTVNPTISMSNKFIYSTVSQSGAWSSYLNSTNLYNSGSNTVAWGTALKIGASTQGYNFNGKVYDVLAYSSAFSADEMQLMNQYQSVKNNMALNPSGTGATEADKAMASDGFSAFTTRYLEYLSASANISLQATNKINFDLKGDTLALASGRNLTLTANSITNNSAGTIQTSGTGNIAFNGTANLTNGFNVNAAGSGSITFSNIAILEANITSNGGAINFNNAVYLTGTTTVNAGNGAVTFASTIDSFISNATFSSVNVLAVAGGGAGGGGTGGGGGGGGVVYDANYAVGAGSTTNFTIGAGGVRGANANAVGGNGGNSTFGTITVIGGGGGGNNNSGLAGQAGGSGGGGAYNTAGGAGTAGQGYAGANGCGCAGNYGASGGGGAGGAGNIGSTTAGGTGGIGYSSNITGTATYYAGGGGGGTYSGGTLGVGGSGGGGSATQAGTANTGGGGGGSIDNGNLAGAGGSGIVIVRYTGTAGMVTATGGTYSMVGSDTVWTFTSNGSFTLNQGVAASPQSLTVNAGSATFGGNVGSLIALNAVSINTANALTLPNITAATILARTTGLTADLTIAAGKTLTATAAGNALVLSAGRNIVNNSGAGALDVDNGRWILYSTTKGNDTTGGLAPTQEIGGQSYVTLPPASVPNAAQNTWVYGSTLGSITITANLMSGTYGGLIPTLTYGFSCSDGCLSNVLIGALTSAAGNAGDTITGNIGNYAITQGTLSASNGYAINFTGNNLQVAAAGLTVTATAGQTKVYGAANPGSYTYTYTGLVNGDLSASFTGALSRAAGENVGNYAIGQNTLAATGNYTITAYNSNNFAITPYVLTVTADPKSKVYGAVDPSLTYTYGALQNGDNSSVFSGGLTRTAGENVGTYAINQGTVSAGSNYTINYVSDNLTITAKSLTVTATSGQGKAYGSSDPTLAYTYTGLTNGDTTATFTGALARAAGETVAGGPYAINQGTLLATGNYTIGTFNADTFAITPYAVTVTADAGQTKVYGAANPVYTYTYGALQNGDTGAIFSGALTRAAGESVAGGPYNITLGTLSAGANYTINYTGDTFAITPYTLAVTANAGQSKTYGAANPVYTYSYGALQNGDTNAVFSGALTRAAGETVAGGPYNITQGTLSAGSNYTISFTGDTFAITPYTLTVTADAKSKVYGAADPILTYTYGALQNGDTSSIFSGSLTRAAGETVAGGPYAISQGTVSAGSNYTINYVGDDLTITPKGLTVTATAGQTKVYGAADPGAYTYTYSGLTNGDLSVTFAGALTRAAGENAGNYAISQGTLASTDSNYSISTFNSSNFTITPYALTVTADTGQTKIYGAANPVYTYTYGALQNGDNASVFSGALSRAAGENVGNYTITQGTLSAGSNYTISYNNAQFAITPYVLTVAATAGQSKTYGASDPIFAFTYGALQNGDTASVFSGAQARAAGNNVGTYAINQGTLSAGGNYTISYTGANFTINQAALIITANNKNRYENQPDPTFTATVSGLQYSDTASVLVGLIFNTNALNNSPPGFYTITPSGATAVNYYVSSYVDGVLRILAPGEVITPTLPTSVLGALGNPVGQFQPTTLMMNDNEDAAQEFARFEDQIMPWLINVWVDYNDEDDLITIRPVQKTSETTF